MLWTLTIQSYLFTGPCLQIKDVPGSVYSLPDGTVVPVGRIVRHDVTLSLSCDPGYQLQRRGVDEFTCDKGDWDPSLSACEGGMLFIGIVVILFHVWHLQLWLRVIFSVLFSSISFWQRPAKYHVFLEHQVFTRLPDHQQRSGCMPMMTSIMTTEY